MEELTDRSETAEPEILLTYKGTMLIWSHVILSSYEVWKAMSGRQRSSFGKDLSFMCKQYSKAISEEPLEKVWEAIRKVDTEIQILSRNILPRDHGLAQTSRPEVSRKERWKDPI